MHVAYAQAGLQRVKFDVAAESNPGCRRSLDLPSPHRYGQRLVDVVVGEQLASERPT